MDDPVRTQGQAKDFPLLWLKDHPCSIFCGAERLVNQKVLDGFQIAVNVLIELFDDDLPSLTLARLLIGEPKVFHCQHLLI